MTDRDLPSSSSPSFLRSAARRIGVATNPIVAEFSLDNIIMPLTHSTSEEKKDSPEASPEAGARRKARPPPLTPPSAAPSSPAVWAELLMLQQDMFKQQQAEQLAFFAQQMAGQSSTIDSLVAKLADVRVEKQTNPVAVATERARSVNVKLPSFMPDNLETWFQLVRSNFAARQVVDDSIKYHFTLAALAAEDVDKLSSFLVEPEEHKFEALLLAIRDAFGVSSRTRMSRLVAMQLADLHPCKLLRRMRQFCVDDMFFELFKLKMPAHVANALSDLDLTVEQYAKRAGQLLEDAKVGPAAPLVASIEDLQVNVVGRGRPPAGPPRTPRPPGRPHPLQTRCKWHAAYGPSARRCDLPCDMNHVPLAPYPEAPAGAPPPPSAASAGSSAGAGRGAPSASSRGRGRGN